MQPAQLSLMPEQVPAPPVTVVAQLPEPKVAAALLLLARLIAETAEAASATGSGQVSVDE